jgi:hypothetical protein
MKRVLSWVGQLMFLAVATFFFIVLYAHGPSDFLRHARQEFGELASWITGGDGAKFPTVQ